MDLFYTYLIPALWLAWIVYWRIAAFGVKPVVRRESVASRISHIVPLMIAALLLIPGRLPDGWLCGRFVPASGSVYAAGTVLVVLGLSFAVWARVRLAGNWSATVTLKREHALVTGGPYRLVRNPIYTGMLLAFVGSALARGEWRGLLAVAIAAAAFWRKLRIEERFLADAFGDDFARYRARVAALIPFLL